MTERQEGWFEFRGTSSAAHHLRLKALPGRPLPVRRGVCFTVPGRSGTLFRAEDAYGEQELTVECIALAGWDPDDCAAWLCADKGYLRFSDDPERVCEARLAEGSLRRERALPYRGQELTLRFRVSPVRYARTQPADEELTQNGGVTNPGTAREYPIWVLHTSSPVTLTVNGKTLRYTGSRMVTIDSQSGTAVYNDGTSALGKITAEELPSLEPGANTVEFEGARSVTIKRRVCYL